MPIKCWGGFRVVFFFDYVWDRMRDESGLCGLEMQSLRRKLNGKQKLVIFEELKSSRTEIHHLIKLKFKPGSVYLIFLI